MHPVVPGVDAGAIRFSGGVAIDIIVLMPRCF